MTQVGRRHWIDAGLAVAIVTVLLLLWGAAENTRAQFSYEQQSAINATLQAEMRAVSDRIAKLESMTNYVLMAVVGSLITQIVQLRSSRK